MPQFLLYPSNYFMTRILSAFHLVNFFLLAFFFRVKFDTGYRLIRALMCAVPGYCMFSLKISVKWALF
jgi:hypothetical protein